MNLEQRSDPGLKSYNCSHYPELDHAPAFAWSGQQEAENRPHHLSDDDEDIKNRQLSDEEDESNISEYQGSMTK